MLTVGVESREDGGAGLAAGVLHTGLNRRTLTEVHRMRHHVRSGAQGGFGGGVAAAVIHAHHMGEHRPQVRDDIADDLRLVESRDDNPDARGVDDHNVHVAEPTLRR